MVLNALARNDGKAIGAVEKKRALMHYLNALKQRLVRLHALVAWAPKNAKATLVAENACNVLEEHAEQFRVSADTLYGLHQRLTWARAPMFDIPASFDVLCRGGFDCLDRVEGIRKVATMQLGRRNVRKGEEEKTIGGDEEMTDVVDPVVQEQKRRGKGFSEEENIRREACVDRGETRVEEVSDWRG